MKGDNGTLSKNELTAIISVVVGIAVVLVTLIIGIATHSDMSRYEYQAYSDYLETCKTLESVPVPPNEYQAYLEYLQTCRFNGFEPLPLSEFQKGKPPKEDKTLEFR